MPKLSCIQYLSYVAKESICSLFCEPADISQRYSIHINISDIFINALGADAHCSKMSRWIFSSKFRLCANYIASIMKIYLVATHAHSERSVMLLYISKGLIGPLHKHFMFILDSCPCWLSPGEMGAWYTRLLPRCWCRLWVSCEEQSMGFVANLRKFAHKPQSSI